MAGKLSGTAIAANTITVTQLSSQLGNVAIANLTIGTGSAAGPSLTATGDNNTGIFFPAADTIAFTEGGFESLRIDSSGNLGIGTVSPGYKLDVNTTGGSAATARLIGNDQSNVRLRLENIGTGGRTWELVGGLPGANNGNFSIRDVTGSTTPLTIDSSGNVGIGTTSPGYRLDISQASADAGLRIARTSSGAGEFRQFIDGDGNLRMNMFSNNAIRFQTNDTERARITSGGDVLINSTANVWSSKFYVEVDTQNASVMEATNASYAQNGFGIFGLNAIRSATSAYSFAGWYSADGTDREFNFRGDGNGYADGTWNNNGADYAEYFESATGSALTVGATVVLDGNKVREATASDPVSAIMGVVRPKEPSKASMVVGNGAWNKWTNKYLTDDFDRYIMEDHDVVEWTDADGKEHSYESHNIPDGVTVPADAVVKTHDDKGNKFQHYKLNPAWDKDAEYTPREKRDEWIIVGLVGQVKVLKGKPMNDRWIKMRDVSAAVEEWMIR